MHFVNQPITHKIMDKKPKKKRQKLADFGPHLHRKISFANIASEDDDYVFSLQVQRKSSDDSSLQ